MNRTEKSIKKFKAIELMKTFSSIEVKRFGRFLQSPYHNTNQDLIKLFDFIRPLYPTFDQTKLTRLKIWKKLFNAIPFQRIKFKKLFSELNLLAEEFIIIEQTRSDKRMQQKRLITALKPRHFKRFKKESQSRIKEIEEKEEYISQMDFLDLHLLYQDLWYHMEWEKHQVNQRELIKGHEALVAYMAFNKVRTISEIETRRKYLNLSDFVYPESLKIILEKELLQENISYSFLQQFLQFEKYPTWEIYLSLKSQIFDSHLYLEKEQIQDGIIHLNNYLANELGKGKIGINEEMFNLLKWTANKYIFITNGKIADGYLRNTVIIALKNKKIDWAKDYLKKNEKYLKSANKQLVIGFLKVSIAFVNKEFDVVLSSLMCLQPSHKNQYYFFFKSLTTRAYFELMLQGELTYQESLYNELDAFEKGVRRNRKFAKARKDSYLNYIKILRQLNVLVLVQENQDAKLVKLKAKVKTLNSLAHRQWLIEKIEFL